MNFNDRFCSNDVEEKNLECMTCGAMCADPWRHHEWHNEQERLEEEQWHGNRDK